MRFGRVLGNSDDNRAALHDFLLRVPELARLDGAAGRVILWVEVEDYSLACEVRKRVELAGLVK